MSDVKYNLQFEKLCSCLQLGKLKGTPEAIPGGLLHRMFAVETTQGKYAIKALNPQIMLRPVAMQNYIDSERVANIAAANIPALAAKIINGTFIHEIDNQYYIVFDWIEGRSLKSNEINEVHCKQIGRILAEIHMMDFSELGVINHQSDYHPIINWHFYLQKGKENNSVWVDLLHENIDMLYEWNSQSNESARQLASDMVISHRDMDPKNVMWNQGNPIIIDWESAGYVNPMKELIETAIYWSGDEHGSIDKERFMAFINGYKEKYGALQANWRIVLLNGFSCGWLEYSLKRSLWIECTDEQEQQMGTAHVTGSINEIKRYADMIPKLENWLYNEIQ